MEGWLFIHLKSVVKWQGNINEMGQNSENEFMNEQMNELHRKERIRWIGMNRYSAEREQWADGDGTDYKRHSGLTDNDSINADGHEKHYWGILIY